MRRVLALWDDFWFKQVETSTLALLRIAFALVMVAWTISLAPTLFAFYSTDGILPAQPDFAGDAAWGLLGVFTSNAAVTILYFLLFLGSISLLFGFQTRVAAIVVFVCLVSFG